MINKEKIKSFLRMLIEKDNRVIQSLCYYSECCPSDANVCADCIMFDQDEFKEAMMYLLDYFEDA